MKKTLSLLSFVMMIFIAGTLLFAREDGRRNDADLQLSKGSAAGPRSTLLNINNMALWLRADGWSARDPRTGNSGVIFPRNISNQLAVIFQDGIVWGGEVQDGGTPSLRSGGQTYNIGTVEGRIVSKGVSEGVNDDVYIYRIRKDYATADLSLDASELNLSEDEVRAQYAADWADWPWEKGAPYTGVGNQLDGGYLGADGATIAGAGNGVLDRGEDSNSNGVLDPGEDANANGVLDGEFPGVAGADMVVWTVLNDLSEGATFGLNGSPPIGLEMQLTAFGYRRTDALGNMVFKDIKLFYEGTTATPNDAVIDPMYITQWSDPDLGTYSDDFVGVDPPLSLAFVYNSSSVDATYSNFGFPPPATGYDFFAGVIVPLEEGDDPNTTAFINFERVPGFKNLPMSSFYYFAAGSAYNDPGPLGSYEATIEWWNLLRGFIPQTDPINPEPYIDNVTGQPTLFPLSGDPVGQSGDLDGQVLSPGDRRLGMVTGPFRMEFGDTQELVIALIAALGSDRLSSVAVLKFYDRTAQATFDNLFQVVPPPSAPVVQATGFNGEIVLDWGFNQAAIEETEGQDVSGFSFEGYNIYQLASQSPDLSPSNAIKLATFDVVNEVTTVLNEAFDPVSGVVLELPAQVGTNSGIKRFTEINTDAFRDRPIANDQDYFFAITAYNATPDPDQTTRALESSPVIVRVRAQQPAPGMTLNAEISEGLEVAHEGPSDGSVVTTVVDPSRITGDDYTVTFKVVEELDDEGHVISSETLWDLTNASTGEVVLSDQSRQTTDPNDTDFLTADGLLVQVFGAPADYARDAAGNPAFIEVANENGPLAEADYDANGTPFGGNQVWHSLNSASSAQRYFISTTTADESGMRTAFSELVPFDFELRYLELSQGTWGWWGFTTGDVGQVPFRIWNVGIATPDDPSDDMEMIPVMFEGAGTSGAYTPDHGPDGAFGGYAMFDRIYWYHGDAAAHEADASDGVMDADYTTAEVIGRMLTGDFSGTGLPPLPNTVIRVFSTKPNTPNDTFTFSTAEQAQGFSAEQQQQDALEMVGVFPNPFLGLNRLQTNPQQPFVRFNHLPPDAKIRIFNLAGTLVRTLPDGNVQQNDQYMDWDLANVQNLPVGSGIYLAHVEMPGVGTKVLKLIVVQQQQFLRTF